MDCYCRKLHVPCTSFSHGASSHLRDALRKSQALQSEMQLSWITNFGVASLALTAMPKTMLPVMREEFVGPLERGLLGVDWVGQALPSSPSAIVMLFPGIGTSAKSGFTAMIAHHLAHNLPSHRVGVAVLQGHDGLPLRSSKVAGSAYVSTCDAGYLLERITSSCLNVPILVIACSAGSAHFTHWAGKHPEQLQRTSVIGGIMFCHGLNFAASMEAAEASGASRFILNEYQNMFKESPPDPELLAACSPQASAEKFMNARTLQEWNELSLPLYGLHDYDDLQKAADTPPELLSRINVPLVFINADNDPVTPAGRLIDQGRICEIVPNCSAIRTTHGSHMAWWEGPTWNLHQTWISTLVLELVTSMSGADFQQDLNK